VVGEVIVEKCVSEYISLQGPKFVQQGRHFALIKALRLLLKHAGVSSVEDLIAKFQGNGNGLHLVLQSFVNELAENNTPKTVHFYVWLVIKFLEFYDVDVSKARRKLSLPKNAATRIDRVPTIAELQKLILKTKSPRLAMLIQLLAQTGLRIGEALRLKVSNIDFENRVIRLSPKDTKTGEGREVPICSELHAALKHYLDTRKIKSPYLFPSEKNPNEPVPKWRIYDTYRDLLKRLGIDERDPSGLGVILHPHTLRKFYKTTLERAGVNRLLIEYWMGHTLGIQGRYFLPTGEDMRREFEKADKALQIFGTLQKERKRIDSGIDRILARTELFNLKLIENELVKLSVMAKRDKGIDIHEVERRLREVDERIAEVSRQLSKAEIIEINKKADELS
jgi:integrase